ncbi:MAG: hypothetical protein HQL48_10820 [Gammaproteobacteria bacterium]|nr:hypothetical protein [Gammaproteobacteria bacterium]
MNDYKEHRAWQVKLSVLNYMNHRIRTEGGINLLDGLCLDGGWWGVSVWGTLTLPLLGEISVINDIEGEAYDA